MEETVSDYKVPFTKILNLTPHNNAEKLEVATVYGFQVIVRKGQYQVGDKVVYIPIDSILPQKLEQTIFPPDAKVKLNNSRVRQIRLRGLASQGMLIDPKDLASFVNTEYLSMEQDLAAILDVRKYEPPLPGPAQTIGKGKNRNKQSDNPAFHKYNGVNSIKWFPDFFTESEMVVIQEKLHGTNARAGLLPWVPRNLWHKVLKFLKLAPKVEKCYGSNNVEISSRMFFKGYYGEDLYGAVFKKLNVFDKIKPNETVFGEIIGPSIQKNYEYGLKEHKFVLFDVKVLEADGKQTWLKPDDVEAFAKERGFDYIPVLYKGPFNKELAYSLTKGDSEYGDKTQKVREGIVIKASEDYSIEGNKKALKFVSEVYLDDKSNTDFH